MKIVAYQMFFHKKMSRELRASGHNLIFLSSERRNDETGIIDSFYKTSFEAELDERILNSIILRCRYLSGINNKQARENVRKIWHCSENFIVDNAPELVVMQAVDNYVADIFCRLCAKHKISCFQPRRSPLPGLVRITNGLDTPKIRDVEENEIYSAIETFRNDFKASYQNIQKRTKSKILLKFLREIAKKILFSYWKRRHSDPLSFHYNAIFPNENAITITSLKQLTANSYYDVKFDQILSKSKNYRDIVFWPLAMCPESAICYMNIDYRLSDYKSVINKVTGSVPDDVLLIVKEHPSAVGFRPISHYESILSRENVVFASMEISTGQLIDISKKVLINTSSTTGIEAAVIGKPVLSLGSCHYSMQNIVHNIDDFDDFNDWYYRFPAGQVAEQKIKKFVRQYLENTIQDGTWGPTGDHLEGFGDKVRKTLEACVALSEKGYVSSYLNSEFDKA
tara:strand:- start:12569 stop:13930 length:1362 start_codon:yes stop_codon:yes gene_type:complete